MTHYDPETLIDCLDGTSPIAAEVEAHLPSCADCTEALAELRELMEMPVDGTVREGLPAVNPDHLREITALAERLEWEGEWAPALCDEILAGPEAWWLQHVRKTAGTQTAGIIKHLLDRMDPMTGEAPETALRIANLALQLAEELDPTAYPQPYIANLHGRALRNRALKLSLAGHDHDALECAERAREVFEQVPGTSYDLARLAMVKAPVLQRVGRAEEAVKLLRKAAATFRAHGELLWYVDARIAQGAALYHLGAVEQALEVWRSVANDPVLDDVRTVRLAHNIALCYADLGL